MREINKLRKSRQIFFVVSPLGNLIKITLMLTKMMITNLMGTILGVTIMEGLVIPHLIATLERLKFLRT
jgi:hypothetical protein